MSLQFNEEGDEKKNHPKKYTHILLAYFIIILYIRGSIHFHGISLHAYGFIENYQDFATEERFRERASLKYIKRSEGCLRHQTVKLKNLNKSPTNIGCIQV